ncbi:MAG TPA: GHKL domain-containing protein [Thiolapillus brandeum]|uniref:histidine kinase n=1 Tax=Thiolapillus brandeum TaxID=1076588 RepID=A0A831K3H5_9GAMM|nr:GHKL domain-containing protein [Thiolapillus brandeum]
MTWKNLIQEQKSLTISIVSFLLMLSIVVIIGFVGGRHIIGYLQGQLVEHGISHNEEVIAGMRPLLESSLQDGVEPLAVVESFQRFIEHVEPFDVRLFLVDRGEGKVIADSEAPKQLPYAVQRLVKTPVRTFDGNPVASTAQWHGTVWRETGKDSIELLTLHDLQMPSTAGQQWALGVSSNLSGLLLLMDELHLHLDVVLLVTYGLIGLFGFLVLRWVGRRYESSLEQQVEERTRQLEKAHEELLDQARLATIGQTATVLAHEMRNPLASIKFALSGLSSSDNLAEREQLRMGLVLGEVDRLEGMLDETLDYVRPVVRDEHPVILDKLLDKVLRLEQPLLEQQHLRVHRIRCSNCPAIELDSSKMQQVLLNLLKNAREASPVDGEIQLAVDRRGDSLVLTIRNQGEPLSKEVQEHAFEFFFTTKARGTGLGLGLVKRVIEEHGGRVELSSGTDGVTTAMLILPLNPKQSAA